MSGPRTTHHLVFRQSHQDSKLILVHPIGQPITVPPIWSIDKSSSNGTMYRGDPSMSNQIGEGSIGSMSGNAKLSLRDHQFTIKGNTAGTKYTVDSSKYGHLKWKVGSRPIIIFLEDDSGIKIAEFKEAGYGDKQLDILVPCDGFFAEMVVLTAILAMRMKKNDSGNWLLTGLGFLNFS